MEKSLGGIAVGHKARNIAGSWALTVRLGGHLQCGFLPAMWTLTVLIPQSSRSPNKSSDLEVELGCLFNATHRCLPW